MVLTQNQPRRNVHILGNIHVHTGLPLNDFEKNCFSKRCMKVHATWWQFICLYSLFLWKFPLNSLCFWQYSLYKMDRIKRIWYLSPVRATKVQASLRICAVSPEPPLLAHTSIESRGTFRQKARSLDPLNGWACTVKICHDGMLKDTNSLDRAQIP